MSKKWLLGVVAVVVAVSALGVGAVVGRDSVDRPTSPPTERVAATGLTEFKHEEAGFSISYPTAWSRLESTDSDVPLIVSEKPVEENQGGSILVRVVPIGVKVTQGQLGEARKLTDGIVTAGQGIEVKAEPTQINQDGLPGYYYLYTFADATSGQRGAHSHYFFFKDENMISVVFQTIPESDFGRLATTFDSVVESFKVLS